MREFYWFNKKVDRPVPHILGLTASPVIGSRLDALETLESLLDSTCRSPRLQKEELVRHVKRPNLTQLHFDSNNEANIGSTSGTYTMQSLFAVRRRLDIYKDPEILRLSTQNTEASRNKLERALKSNKTFIQDQLNSFNRRASEIYRTIGGWAADYYVSQITSTCIKSSDSEDRNFWQWEDSEKQYLANALQDVDVSIGKLAALSENSISHKVRVLIDFLNLCDKNTIGIIFVKERAIAYMLYHLLSIHPETRNRLRFQTIAGTSQRPRGKRDMCELPSCESALAKFRSGEINILIATSVLEEGIDVPQCHLVVCFDEPSNLRSYIQCRGRARLPESRWVIMLDTYSEGLGTQWEDLEREMKLRYEEEERQFQTIAQIEASEEKQARSRKFRVQSTGALLHMDDAKGHLQCFCSRLASRFSVDMRPEYIIIEEEEDDDEQDDQPLLSAKVILPATVDFSLRVSKSTFSWRSEKNATKDAAFNAYIALYHAGLVNDQLLPLSFEEPSKYMEKGDSIVEVHDQHNPWIKVAQAWEREERLQGRTLSLKDQHGVVKCKVDMSIPTDLPKMRPIPIYWDAFTEWTVEVGRSKRVPHSELTACHTTTLLSLAYGHDWEIENMRHVVLFKVRDMDACRIRLVDVSLKLEDCKDDSVDLLRGPLSCGHPDPFYNWPEMKSSIGSIESPPKVYESFPDDQAFVALEKLPQRSDFLHPVTPASQLYRQECFRDLPQSSLRVNAVPTILSQFGRLIPSILHQLEIQLVVEELCATTLVDVAFPDRKLIRTAISTPAAREQDNYQKLEFLGDSVLKFLISIFVASKCE